MFKMSDYVKMHWTATLLSAVGCGGIVLGIMYKKKIYQHLWGMKINSIIKGTSKKAYVISTPGEWEKISSQFINSGGGINALGFDCEWCYNGYRQPVALLQLATFSGTCALLQLPQLIKNIPPSLKEILENEKIIKVGVDPFLDSHYLQLDYNLQVRGCVDLRHLAIESRERDCRYDSLNGAVGNKLGLSSLAESCIGRKLNKSKKVRLSNWESKDLTKVQVNYASEDALVGVHLLLHFIEELHQFESIWPLLSRSWKNSLSDAINDTCSAFKDSKFRSHSRASPPGYPEKKSDLLVPNKVMKETRQAYSFRKTPLYHNSQLWAPDNEPLCTCDPHKALWYVNKELGEIITQDPLIVRLKFEPAGRPNKEGNDGQFYLQERANVCVVCGKGESYIRKNVVPHEYRKHFPEILKAHQSHDVVLLCANCHQHSNIKDNTLRYQLAREFDAPLGFETDVKVQVDQHLKVVRSAAGALLKNRSKIPKERIEHLETIVKNFYNCESITEDQLQEASNLDILIHNKDYVPHGLKVYSAFERTGLIRLEERWRQWFLDTMQPRFLPDKWSVSHNHKKLRRKMSELPLDHPLRKDFKIALVGSEGSIDLPFVPKESKQNGHVVNGFGLE